LRELRKDVIEIHYYALFPKNQFIHLSRIALILSGPSSLR